MDAALFPGVDGLAVEGKLQNVIGADAQDLCRAAQEQGFIPAYGKV
jgi:hypothetical protein